MPHLDVERMSQLSLYLFGPPRLELDGTPFHIPRRKAMALLAYLAATGQVHNRDSLAALLWPENDQSSARGGLRRMLSEIKGALGEGWLATDREIAQLITHHDLPTGKSFWLDVTAFQENIHICEAHNHPPTVTCHECLPALETAVALYQDDFMAGFSLIDCPAYDDWQFFQWEQHRSQLAGALVRLSSHYANTSEYESAIHYARRRLQLDQFHEPSHQQLMALYDQAGQRSAALRQYKICRETLANELGVEPSEETISLYQRIQASTLVAAMGLRPSNNLPVQTTPLIGRTNEMTEIQEKLGQDNCRLLTLHGPGGSGKTRLAIETAGQLLVNFKHGVFFVDLAPLQGADLIPVTVATAIKFPISNENTPAEQLLEYLRDKEMLLILDNFEHLLDGVGFVHQMMNAAPGVKILTTSRNRLMVTGEHLYSVMGMTYPESPVSLKTVSDQYSAVRLFESEASRADIDFRLSDDNFSDVVQICSLLEGMPLGIVLSANWVTMLTPSEIAAEISQDLAILEATLQDLPQRQRSMYSVFNYSWRLLSEGEREIMRALSVFLGGFTREAAQKIAGASLVKLKNLIDQSMLHRTPEGRYEIHELVRQYASEKLGEHLVTEQEIKAKFSDYFCKALASWEHDLQRWQQAKVQKEISLEIDNIRKAWFWAVEQLKVNLLMDGINGLCLFYDRKQLRAEGEAVCWSLAERLETLRTAKSTESADQDTAQNAQIDRLKLQARVLGWCGFFNMHLGNLDRSQNLLQKCLSITESDILVEEDTRFEEAVAYAVLPAVMDQSQRDETERLAEKAVTLFRSQKDDSWASYLYLFLVTYNQIITVERWYQEEMYATLRKLGDLKILADFLEGVSYGSASNFRFEQSDEVLSEALAISTELDDRLKVVSIYGHLGWQWVWQGRFEEARTLYHETMKAYSDLEYTQSEALILHAHLGYPDLYLGDYQAAREHVQRTTEVLKESEHFHVGLWKAIGLDILGKVALVEGFFDEAEKYFQYCMNIVQTYDHREKISTTLACLGYIARERGQISLGQSYFFQALKKGIEIWALPTLAHALPGIALLFANLEDDERAVEIYALASTMGMVDNSQWFTDVAGDELAKVTTDLPAEITEAAKNRVQAPVSWETAADLLSELEELGWDEALGLINTI